MTERRRGGWQQKRDLRRGLDCKSREKLGGQHGEHDGRRPGVRPGGSDIPYATVHLLVMKGHAGRNSQLEVGWVGPEWVTVRFGGFCSKWLLAGWLASCPLALQRISGGTTQYFIIPLAPSLFRASPQTSYTDVFPPLILPSPTSHTASTHDTAKRRKVSSTTDIQQARRGPNSLPLRESAATKVYAFRWL